MAENHEEKDVRNNLYILRSLAKEIQDSMPWKVKITQIEHDEDHKVKKNSTENEGNIVVKKIHFIRHGEGTHNVAQREWRTNPDWDGKSEPYTLETDPDFKYMDATLTPVGEGQAKDLQKHTMKLTPDLLVVSPLRRATQTGILAFEPHIKEGKIKVIANELAHEMGGKHSCDKRLDKSELQSMFPMVSYADLEYEIDPLWGNGMVREAWSNVAERARDFALWLKDREEKHIAVASHSAFLLSIFNAVFIADDINTQNWFGTGEMRTVMCTFTEAACAASTSQLGQL
mmetsp:Transcript_16791/g.20717  ORF Transcript_16791/g.20717 Transcript_16791/m.20717 type:complete len:287 (-) Transcript_16791:343-1203(-)|eukprot:CAMPEP_0204830202 /NCGR_PEP_ID=MMETSP1346-20131115/8392_1 /ASSEMBLY_ACC=CAM_ASM_000771 /TAXON_ID=215587 /ORGANISM="Aplanochytrium stocchinoi, Strain GSBS06" /LENGTH=286 /DNA_ID=CAMNT_0051960353 /DNA_START=137 /DNA_END=997 /DNA_ORIENTATION=+